MARVATHPLRRNAQQGDPRGTYAARAPRPNHPGAPLPAGKAKAGANFTAASERGGAHLFLLRLVRGGGLGRGAVAVGERHTSRGGRGVGRRVPVAPRALVVHVGVMDDVGAGRPSHRSRRSTRAARAASLGQRTASTRRTPGPLGRSAARLSVERLQSSCPVFEKRLHLKN